MNDYDLWPTCCLCNEVAAVSLVEMSEYEYPQMAYYCTHHNNLRENGWLDLVELAREYNGQQLP